MATFRLQLFNSLWFTFPSNTTFKVCLTLHVISWWVVTLLSIHLTLPEVYCRKILHWILANFWSRDGFFFLAEMEFSVAENQFSVAGLWQNSQFSAAEIKFWLVRWPENLTNVDIVDRKYIFYTYFCWNWWNMWQNLWFSGNLWQDHNSTIFTAIAELQ